METAESKRWRRIMLGMVAGFASGISMLSRSYRYSDERQFLWLAVILLGGLAITTVASRVLQLPRGARWDGFGRAAVGVASIAGGIGKLAGYLVAGETPDPRGLSRIAMFLCLGGMWLLEERRDRRLQAQSDVPVEE